MTKTRVEKNLPAGWKQAYFSGRPVATKTNWNYLRIRGKKHLSFDAQLKLEWMIFYHTVGNHKATATALHFGITRKTFHKWLARFKQEDIFTLEEQSRAPERKRHREITREEEHNIILLRRKNMELGKKKLKVLYKKEYGEDITTWKIECVIRARKLYPDPKKHKIRHQKRQKAKLKVRMHEVKDTIKGIQEFGFLWHIDAIIIWWYGQRRIIFTALEDKTKIAYARVYTTNTSSYSHDFLKRLMYLVEGKVAIMHSDNGSEFAGNFEKACEQLHILQIYSRPHTPKDNPALERFNNTIQREWLDFSEVGLDEIQEANEDLTTWLIKYNSYRPHASLDYLTPLEYAQQHFFDVSPMWSARTYT
ncbi:MAG: integrase core domain-containing protein [Rhabdochlamydiaceae bacterium]